MNLRPVLRPAPACARCNPDECARLRWPTRNWKQSTECPLPPFFASCSEHVLQHFQHFQNRGIRASARDCHCLRNLDPHRSSFLRGRIRIEPRARSSRAQGSSSARRCQCTHARPYSTNLVSDLAKSPNVTHGNRGSLQILLYYWPNLMFLITMDHT